MGKAGAKLHTKFSQSFFSGCPDAGREVIFSNI
jgi:hypothetical protein